MEQRYQFTITGMTCHACVELITMDLADAGFTPTALDHQTGLLEIELEPAVVDTVRQVIDQTEKYHVVNVTAL